MGLVKPDYSAADKKLEEGGKYRARIVSVSEGMGQKARYLRWELETNEGWKFSYFTPVEGRGAGILKHFLETVLDTDYDGGEFDPEDVLDSHVTITVSKQKNADGSEGKYFNVSEVEPDQEPKEQDLPF